jgi:peptide/nickel transport system permease protein
MSSTKFRSESHTVASAWAVVKPVARALAVGLLTLWVISIVTFAMTSSRSKEATAIAALGQEAATPELIEEFIRQNDLDAPAYVRYVRWLQDFATGDWGGSAVTGRSVRAEIVPRFWNTLKLTVLALLAGIPISIAIGVYAASRAGSRRDAVVTVSTVVIAAIPEFILGLGLILLLAVYVPIFPVDSTAASFGTASDKALALVLPTVTLAIHMIPYMTRMTRAAAREAFGSAYVRAAVLRGLSRRRVVWVHGMKNAGVPLVNAIALNLVWLLGGVIVVENLFAYPGIGQLLVYAIDSNDALMVQALAMVMGAMFVTVSIVADLTIVYLNPRLRRAHG